MYCFRFRPILQLRVRRLKYIEINYVRESYNLYHIPYQPENLISARGSKARGLIMECRVDIGCDTNFDIHCCFHDISEFKASYYAHVEKIYKILLSISKPFIFDVQLYFDVTYTEMSQLWLHCFNITYAQKKEDPI